MFKTVVLAACMLVAVPFTADADPVGTYSLIGKNPDSGKDYTGTVTVTRTGDTYAVVWNIGGGESVGTGIGARLLEDHITMGPATDEDTGISVGYKLGDTFGIAMFFEQPDGTWAGVWTYNGSKQVTGEVWTRQ